MRPDRLAKVNRLVQTTLAEMIPEVIRDPRLQSLSFISVTAVRTTPDLHRARVFVSIPGSDEERENAMKAMESASGFLRRELGQRIKLRYTPELIFTLDKSLDSAAHIEQILHEIHAEGDGGESE